MYIQTWEYVNVEISKGGTDLGTRDLWVSGQGKVKRSVFLHSPISEKIP